MCKTSVPFFFLYNNQLDALISQLFWNETLHVTDSSSVHHQELLTVNLAMVYVIQACRQLSSSSRIRMELSKILIRMELSNILILLESCL
jgi:hypothetical protein